MSFNAECDAQFYRKKIVVIYGSGSSAVCAAEKLVPIADSLVFLPYTGDENTRARVDALGVEIMDTTVAAVSGKREMERVHLSNGKVMEASVLFIEVGPKWIKELGVNVGIFPGLDGYLGADENQSTYLDGAFACGEVCGPPSDLEKNISSGIIAGRNAVDFVSKASKVD